MRTPLPTARQAIRRLTLTEFRTSEAVPLTPEERDALRSAHPGLRVEPTMGRRDAYDITPDHHVGVVALPALVAEIRPKIPVYSAAFLISYAADAAAWRPESAELRPEDGLTELIAVMLARAVERSTRRGLLTGYLSVEESLSTPRGRLAFAEQLRRRPGVLVPMEVQHDVFTADIIENRILLGALRAMNTAPLRSHFARRELSRASRLFGEVSRVHFPRHAIPEPQVTPLNQHYGPALLLATTVLRSMSLDLGRAGPRGSAFLIDMNRVFEEFVRTALRDALNADRRSLPDRPREFYVDAAGTIPLRPDLCLLERGRPVWIGDAKYKRLPDGGYHNADVYQLLAYTVASGLPEGMLIYAADSGTTAAEHIVTNVMKRLRVLTLDLSQPPAAILQQIRSIAATIRAAQRAAS